MSKKNTSGAAYGLTLLCPIANGTQDDQSYAERLRDYLENLPVDGESPMAKVPNTYLARFYILNDVFFESYPAEEEHLQSKYLVFSSNFYGDLETYLREMWSAAESDVREIWQNCVAFDQVDGSDSFVEYIKRCQVDNNLFFNGSTDDPLAEQLKALYLKQEFTRFAHESQGLSAEELQGAFQAFIEKAQPSNLAAPTWSPGG